MIFNYGSTDFEELRGHVCKILDENINDSSLNQDKRNLICILREILDKDNVARLSNLDGINLKFNSWSYPDASLNNNLLSAQNIVLLRIYHEENSAATSVDSIIESLYLVLYADLYEASLIIPDYNTKKYFEEVINKLQYYVSILSDESFKRLTYLYFDIPKNVFTVHLNQHLDIKVLETVEKRDIHRSYNSYK